jgi:two-component system alkaline phosphatase synthesis response regulator PhoP
LQSKILVADDEKSIIKILAYALQREGYLVETAHNGSEALSKIKQFQPHIALLDVMMPDKTGYDICREIGGSKQIGIILLTAKNDIVDKVLGMELGADDYITKPFDVREVLVRVKSLLRRLSHHQQPPNDADSYRIHDLVIYPTSRKVLVKNNSIRLTAKEFDLLVLLVKNEERVYTREELLDIVWGMEYVGGTRTVDIHIRRLRQKLGKPYDSLLQTVHGVGYKAVHQLDEHV